jgi:alpha-D-ribose 1-methylphosphonate 5-triphosphate synthase subunit PhnL
MPPTLQIEGLRKTFRLHNQGETEILALAGLNLSVAPGECVALTGASGAGKSTVLRCVYGNYAADAGRVLVRHGDSIIDVARNDHRQILALRRRTVGYVSQFLRVVPRVSALDVVSEPALRGALSPTLARGRAAELLERVGIPERLWRLPPQTFSGGERQRVNIARGFAYDYDLLLLDEPTASLDAENRGRVAALIEDAMARGAAILGVFHDLGTAQAVGARPFSIETPAREIA